MKSYEIRITAKATIHTSLPDGGIPVEPVATAQRNLDHGDLWFSPTCNSCGATAHLHCEMLILVRDVRTPDEAVAAVKSAIRDGTIATGELTINRFEPVRVHYGDGSGVERAGYMADKVLIGGEVPA